MVPATIENIENVLSLPQCVVSAPNLDPIRGLLEKSCHGAYIKPQGALNRVVQPPIIAPEIKPIILPEGLELLPFQREGIEFIESRNGRALIGDEMGLGKTIQALGWLRIHPELRIAILVVPSSIKYNWKKEATKWLGPEDKIEILNGRPSETNQILKNTTVIIVNYDILFDILDKETDEVIQPGWWGVLKALNPSVLVLDESTFIKSNVAKRTKAVQTLADSTNLESAIPHIIALSGTPILNRPIEFYNTINLIDPKLFPSWWKFTTRYCGRFQKDIYVRGGKKRRVTDFSGATNVDELYQILTNTCLPYGTMLYTPVGELPIGEIVENEIQTQVCSFNSETGKIQWGQITAYSRRIAPSKLLRILHETGEFSCTPDHMVWTKEKGYLRAEKIIPGISLLMVQEKENSSIRSYRHKHHLLLYKMCCPTQSIQGGSCRKNGDKTMGSKKIYRRRKKMPSMRKSNMQSRGNLWGQNLGGYGFLFYELRSNMEECQSYTSCDRWASEWGKEAAREEKNSHRKKYRRKKTSCQKIKRKKVIRRTVHSIIRRTKKEMGKGQSKWESPKIVENITTCKKTTFPSPISRGLVRISNHVITPNGKVPKGSCLFYSSRYRISRNKIGYRGRRTFPQFKGTEIKRFLEGKAIDYSRVVSIKDYEPRNRSEYIGSGKENYVYDIEIKGNHNFFADNILVHNCMLRRLKKDVLNDLPDKLRSVIPLEIDNRKEYTEAENDFIDWLKNKEGEAVAGKAKKAQALVKFGKLQQLSMHGKIKPVISWIHGVIDNDEKLVVFVTRHETADRLLEEFGKKAVKMTGRENLIQRQEAVDRFQTDPTVLLFIGMIDSQGQPAGVGITLVVATHVAFIGFPWSPAILSQAEDRLHRIGQKNAVNVYYLVAEKTIEEDIIALLDRKREVLNRVLDGEAPEEGSILTELLNKYRDKGA